MLGPLLFRNHGPPQIITPTSQSFRPQNDLSPALFRKKKLPKRTVAWASQRLSFVEPSGNKASRALLTSRNNREATLTASILLVRHAVHADLGQRLTGRGPDGGLVLAGVEQARRLGEWLADQEVSTVHASPRGRAQQTAAAIKPDVLTAGALDEVNFGEWTGRRYEELNGTAWDTWNAERATARVPGGESMAEAQQRAVGYVEQVARASAGRVVALVSHCDIIRAIVAWVLGLSLNRILSFDVDPASVTRIVVGDWGARLVSLNELAPA